MIQQMLLTFQKNLIVYVNYYNKKFVTLLQYIETQKNKYLNCKIEELQFHTICSKILIS